MKRIWGIILAGCVGMSVIASATLAAAEVRSGPTAPAPGLSHATIHAHGPTNSGDAIGTETLRPDFDPEAESDDEGWLIGVGGHDRDLLAPLAWWVGSPVTLASTQADPWPRLPRWFPIRC